MSKLKVAVSSTNDVPQNQEAKGGKMKKTFLGLGMLSAFLLAVPALAQNVDQKIQAQRDLILDLQSAGH